MDEKCQHCGSERCEVEPLTHVYVCGSSEHLRHADCYRIEIKSLRSALSECVDWCETNDGRFDIITEILLIANEALDNGD